MAHPNQPGSEAVDASESHGDEDAVAAFNDYLSNEDEELPEDGDESEGGEPDEDDPEDGDDAEKDEQDSDEPSEAINAPVSLNAEEKAVFAQLPPEAQRAWAASENRRNSQVQEATTKAANAQRNAEARAAEAHSKAKAVFAEQLAQFASHFSPQPPDPALARANPGEYIAQEAQYKAMKAQHDELVQQVAALGQEAEQEIDQAFIQQRDRELLAIPEVANAETRDGFFTRAFEAAEALGYDRDTLLRDGNATDFKALVFVHGLKEKAAKYDAMMAKQMQRVRDGKTAKPGAAQPKGSSTARALKDATTRLRKTGSDADAIAAFEALGI
jgi:hypothetical protein